MNLLRKYFLLGAVPALIAVGLATILQFAFTHYLLEEQINRTLQAKLEARSFAVRHFLDERLSLLTALAATPQVREGTIPEILEFLGAQQDALAGQIDGLYFDELDGTVYAPHGEVGNVHDRDYFRTVLRGETTISRILQSRDTGAQVLLLLEPVRTPDGTLRGALALSIQDKHLAQFVQKMEVDGGGFYALMDEANRLIATAGNARLFQAVETPTADHTLTDEQGRQFVVSNTKIPHTRWHLIAAYPQAEIQALYNRMLWSKLTGVGFGLTAAMLLAYFFSQRTLRPLQQVIGTIGRYAQGEATARVSSGTVGEYAVLADSFNTMADQLETARRQQQEHLTTLEASETRFRLLFDGAADAILLRDMEGRIIDANREACRSLGYTRDELVGMHVSDIDVDWGKDTSGETWNRLASEQGLSRPLIERVHRRKDGSTFPVEIRLTTIEREGEKFVMATARDATLRKAAEVQLKTAKEFAEKVIHASPGITFIYDLPTQSMTFVSDNIEKELGYTPAEAVAMGPELYKRISHEEDMARVAAAAVNRSPLPDGEIRSDPFRLRHADGRWEWFDIHRVNFQHDANGNMTQVMGVAINTSDRVRAEQQLYREKALLDQVMETSVAAIIVTDAQGNCKFLNTAAEKTLRVRRQEVQGHSLNSFSQGFYDLEGNDWPPEERPFAIVKRTLKPVYDVQYRVEFAPETHMFLSMNGAPLFNEKGQFDGAVFTLTDITQRIEAEKVREELIRNLEATNQELKQFTYTVSHDLKSPLITIKGFLGVLEEDLENHDTAAIAEDLAVIGSAADSMKQLLDDLLELSRIGRSFKARSRVPLLQSVSEATTLLAGEIETSGADIHIETGDLAVFGDPVQMRQLMQNLIDNSIKHSNGVRPEIHISARTDQDFVLIEIADNGPGIVPEYQERIFQLFDKLDPNSEGTGIGLAIVKRIVDVHGGTVWVDSQGQGGGCRFYVRLPATSTDPHNRLEMPDAQLHLP